MISAYLKAGNAFTEFEPFSMDYAASSILMQPGCMMCYFSLLKMGSSATRAARLAAGKIADWRKRPGKKNSLLTNV